MLGTKNTALTTVYVAIGIFAGAVGPLELGRESRAIRRSPALPRPSRPHRRLPLAYLVTAIRKCRPSTALSSDQLHHRRTDVCRFGISPLRLHRSDTLVRVDSIAAFKLGV